MNEWDEELRMLAARIEALESYAEELKKSLEAFEKANLLRLPGQSHCRVCAAGVADAIEPPMSGFEEEFHLAGHGEPSPEHPRPHKWSDVEKFAAEKHDGK